MLRYLLFLFLLVTVVWAAASEAALYGVARLPAPVLNTPGFKSVFGGQDGRTLKTDHCGQVRALEYIALPGTVFRLLEQVSGGEPAVFRVETDEYPTPAGGALYVESRFLELKEILPPPRSRQLPLKKEILSRLKTGLGSPYVWGGNIQQGVGELMGMFYRGTFSKAERERLTLTGLDCSGLLYQATDGATPRNTSQLISFGAGLPITGKTADELLKLLEPLDLIVWNGHVLIVLDKQTVIESRLDCSKPGHGGVVITSLRQRLTQIMRTRSPINEWPPGSKQKDVFVVRRWFGL
ncbi:MAG TPA: hypothetical protein VGJ93_14045 [Desulfuromonadaceae bacterium]|jgi:hypothetical protein